MVVSSNEYILICKSYPEKCLLAFLNSKTISWLLSNITGNLGGNSKIGQKSNFIKLHVPQLETGESDKFVRMVDKILYAKSTNNISLFISSQARIEKEIYQYFKLTQEEIEIIESQ